MSPLDAFEKIGESLYLCTICGEEIPSGIINISGHWAKCGGKQTMDFVNKVADSNLYIEDKMSLIKQEFKIEQ